MTASLYGPRAVLTRCVTAHRIYCRTLSEVNWTRSRFVGDVTEFTMTYVIIDNCFSGVAAVGINGQKSLVALPR